jgi:hypothetical protein
MRITLQRLIYFTNKWMLLYTINISPREIIVWVLQQKTVLVATDIIWLPRLPVAIGDGVWSSGISPFKYAL